MVAPSQIQLVIDIVAGWLGWNDIISGAAGVEIWSEAGQGGGWRQVINIIALVLITNIPLVTSMFICSISMENISNFSKSSQWPPGSRKIWGKDHPAAKTRERRDSAYQGCHQCLNCHQCLLIEIYKTDIYFSVRWMRSWFGPKMKDAKSLRIVRICTILTLAKF